MTERADQIETELRAAGGKPVQVVPDGHTLVVFTGLARREPEAGTEPVPLRVVDPDGTLRFTIRYSAGGDGWIMAQAEEVPGAISQGRTRQAAREKRDRRATAHAQTRATRSRQPD